MDLESILKRKKIISGIFISIFLLLSISAGYLILNQPPKEKFSSYYNQPEIKLSRLFEGEWATALQLDNHGDYITLDNNIQSNENLSSGLTIIGLRGNAATLLTNISPSGKINQRILIGGIGNYQFSEFVVDSQGNFIVCTINDANNGYLMKFNSSGYVFWNISRTYWKILRTIYEVNSHPEIFIDMFNNIYVTATVTQGKPYDSYHALKDKTDVVVDKFSENGTNIWTNIYGGLEDDLAIDLAIGSNNHVFLLELSKSSGYNTTGDNIVVSNLLDNGSIIWTKNIPVFDIASVSQIKLMIDKDNNIIIYGILGGTGSTNEFLRNDIQTTHYFTSYQTFANFFIIKINLIGNLVWKNFYGGIEASKGYFGRFYYDGSTTATIDSNNNIILTGVIDNFFGNIPLLFPFKTYNANTSIVRSFIIILGPDGSLKFSSYWTSAIGIIINGLVCLQDNSLAFTGMVRTTDYNLSSNFQSDIIKTNDYNVYPYLTVIRNPLDDINSYNITIKSFDPVVYSYKTKQLFFRTHIVGSTTISNLDFYVSAKTPKIVNNNIIINPVFKRGLEGPIFNPSYYQYPISFSMKNPPDPPIWFYIIMEHKLVFNIIIKSYS